MQTIWKYMAVLKAPLGQMSDQRLLGASSLLAFFLDSLIPWLEVDFLNMTLTVDICLDR